MSTRRNFMGGIGAGFVAATGVKASAATGGDDGPPPLGVEGYADRLSYRAGDVIGLHVSTTAPQYSLEVTRLGAKNEVVLNKPNLPGTLHPDPRERVVARLRLAGLAANHGSARLAFGVLQRQAPRG